MELVIRFIITVIGVTAYYWGQGYPIWETPEVIAESGFEPNSFFSSTSKPVTLFQFGLFPYFIVTGLINLIFLLHNQLKAIPETKKEKLIEQWVLIVSLLTYSSLLSIFTIKQLTNASSLDVQKLTVTLFFGILLLLSITVLLNKGGLGNSNALSVLVTTNLIINSNWPNTNEGLVLAFIPILLISFFIVWGERKYFNSEVLTFSPQELKTVITANLQTYPHQLNSLGLLPLLGLTIIESGILPTASSFKSIILNGLFELLILSIILFLLNQIISQLQKLTLTFSANNLTFSNIYPGRQTLKYLIHQSNKVLIYNVGYVFFVFQVYSLLHWLLGVPEVIPAAGLFIIIKTLLTIFIQAQQYTFSTNVVRHKIATPYNF